MKLPPSSRPARRGVVIAGAYGMDNAGDDAVLTAILAQLRRIDGDMPITVLARNPKTTAARFAVEAVHPLRFLAWHAALRRAALFLSGGGSLLQDVTSRRSLAYYLLTIRAARRRGCAVQLYGCGVGPLIRERSRREVSRTLNACADVITLRDSESRDLLAALGVQQPRILLAADPALALTPAPAERERAAGFVLRFWPGFRERVPDLAAAARYVCEKYKLAPVFLCLAPEDREAARAVCRVLEAQGVPCSVSVDARRVGRMSLVLSMRLHGLIFALREAAPAVGVSYDPKVSAFCREAGLPCLSLADAAEDALRTRIDEAVHLDGESLSAALSALRRRERINGGAAAELLAGED